MLRTHDVVLADGTFRLVLTPRHHVIAAIDAPTTMLGPIHVAVEIDRSAFAHERGPSALMGPSYETAGLFDDIGHVAEGAFNAASHAANTIARPAFDALKHATAQGAHLIAHATPFLPDAARRQLDAASRVVMRARLGDLTAKQFIRTIGAAAKSGVEGARQVADHLVDATRMVAKAVDAPVALASHVPVLGDLAHAVSPLQKFSTMLGALQKGDFGAIERMARDELALAQSVLPMVPGLGTGVSAAIAAGLSALQGGSPIEIAVRTAYAAIPIPPGLRSFTDGAVDAALALATNPQALTDVGVQLARDRIPSGLPRDVFDTLIHIVAHRAPIQRTGSMIDHYVRQYAHLGQGVRLDDVMRAVQGQAAGPSSRLIQPLHALVAH